MPVTDSSFFLQQQPAEQPTPPEAKPVPAPGRGPNAQIDSIVQFGQPSPTPKMPSEIQCVSIVGQIEGHLSLPPNNKTTKYEHVIPQLVAIEQNKNIKGLLVILNTVGGDIEAGLAIAEMIESISKPTVSLVLGGGHSIGAPIAVAADYSFIADTATITIHPIRLTGFVIGVPQTYEYLDKMQDRVIRFLIEHSESKAKLGNSCSGPGFGQDVGTVLIGQDPVEVGHIDQVGGLKDALNHLELLIAQGKGESSDGPGG